jgi:hypothetical protein
MTAPMDTPVPSRGPPYHYPPGEAHYLYVWAVAFPTAAAGVTAGCDLFVVAGGG